MPQFQNTINTRLVQCKRCAGTGKLVKGLELDVQPSHKYEEAKKKYLNSLKTRQKSEMLKENPRCTCCGGAGLVDANHMEACRVELLARREAARPKEGVTQQDINFKNTVGRWPWENKNKGE
jgi:RecJ-like exonuclease